MHDAGLRMVAPSSARRISQKRMNWRGFCNNLRALHAST